MCLIDLIKKDLGISHNKKDTEFEEMIEMCRMELWSAGVVDFDDSDPRIKQAVCIFARYWLNYQGDGARYQERFEAIKQQMAHCSFYNGGHYDEE